MHAGGVAESSAPWNDDKDPFEVDSVIMVILYLPISIYNRHDSF